MKHLIKTLVIAPLALTASLAFATEAPKQGPMQEQLVVISDSLPDTVVAGRRAAP